MSIRVLAPIGVAALLSLSACLDGSGGAKTTTETHWLMPCDADIDCQGGRDYTCICGACTPVCDATVSCVDTLHEDDVERYEVTSEGVACVSSDRLGSQESCDPDDLAQPGICLPTCPASDDQCDGPDDSPFEIDLVCADDQVCESPEVPFGVTTPSGGDNNNRPSEAVPLDVGQATMRWLCTYTANELSAEDSVTGRLDPAEDPSSDTDRDFYRFELLESSWVAIVTSANPSATLGQIDLVVALFDESGSQLAANDNPTCWFQSAFRSDSELVVHLPEGRYIVEVVDATDWNDLSLTNDPGDYRIGVGRLDSEPPTLTVATEGGDDAASAVEILAVSEVTLLLGTLDGPDDVDVFSISNVPRALLTASRAPDGVDGYGGPRVRMWITQTGSDRIIARVDGERRDLTVPVEPGDYYLWVSRDESDALATSHYIIQTNKRSDPAVREGVSGEDANDYPSGAETLAGGAQEGQIVVRVEEGDVDYIALPLSEGWEFSQLECRSWIDGAGILELGLELRDSGDSFLEQALSEGLAGGAYLFGTEATTPGTYYLRLENYRQDPEVSGTFVRCIADTRSR